MTTDAASVVVLPQDFWKPFGQETWREMAQATKCSEKQLLACVARFNGASQQESARLAGYPGPKANWRTAGYTVVRSSAFVALMELATINSPGDAKISDKEIDAKIARLVRSPDAQISLKAVEAYQRRETQKAERERLSAEQPPRDPATLLRELSAQDALHAIELALEYGLSPFPTPSLLKSYANTIAGIVLSWSLASLA